jgi:choline dehydrogenase-like flavoprotein
MIVDARSVPQNQVVETDICIVGAGTAGITLARELIGKNFRVCLLESGGEKPDRDTLALSWGHNVGHPYFPLDTSRPRCLCGSTIRWEIPLGADFLGARMRPFDEIDFEEREGIPFSGWPFDRKNLDSYYDRAQTFCRIGPSTFDPSKWSDKDKRPCLPLNENSVITVVFKFGSQGPFINEYQKEVKLAKNIHTYLNANVTNLETTKDGNTVKKIHVACLNGKKFTIYPKWIVLAAGGLEIPRLLLVSNNDHKTGLGNSNDLVGRFFMEHLHFESGIFVPRDQNIFTQTTFYNQIHTVNNVPVIGKLALSEKLLRAENLLDYSAQLYPRVLLREVVDGLSDFRTKSKGIQALKKLRTGLKENRKQDNLVANLYNSFHGICDITRLSHQKIRNYLSRDRIRIFKLGNMVEQAPNPDSRVTLSQDRDAVGMNRIRLDWKLSPIDFQSVFRAQEVLDQELREAGLGELLVEFTDENEPPLITGGWHHMGTTRMHEDPKKGVVDANCKVHGISNLYIAGPSVFPTGGYANPSLTIVALTIRLADHLKELIR